jgi:hypothetical protein
MGKRGFQPKIKDIHLREIIYGYSNNPEIYKRLEDCVDEEDDVRSDEANFLFKQSENALHKIKNIYGERKEKDRAKGIKHTPYTRQELMGLKYWRIIYKGSEKLLEYSKDQPKNVLPKDILRGKELFKKQSSEWLFDWLNHIHIDYEVMREENTFFGKTTPTDQMKFLRMEMRAVGRELIRRGFIKAGFKENVYLSDYGLVSDSKGEDIDLAKWNVKNECWDFNINIDVEFIETHPPRNDECKFRMSEHCKICPWSEGCKQKDTPLPPSKVSPEELEHLERERKLKEWFKLQGEKEKNSPKKPEVKKPFRVKKRESEHTDRGKDTRVLD